MAKLPSRGQEWWDRWFLGLAKYVSGASKDPSTQTGAVITDGKRVVSVGFNGLPSGIIDSEEILNDRATKYRSIIHCKMNAAAFANRSLKGCTLYTWPFASCSNCASYMIQIGITRVVAPITPPALRERWGADIEFSAKMFLEAGVEMVLYNDKII